MKQINIGTNTLLTMAKNLKDRGEITLEQYAEMLRRSKEIDSRDRVDLIIIR